jgi:hypothetical protein
MQVWLQVLLLLLLPTHLLLLRNRLSRRLKNQVTH